jgi:hypothetical protein
MFAHGLDHIPDASKTFFENNEIAGMDLEIAICGFYHDLSFQYKAGFIAVVIPVET